MLKCGFLNTQHILMVWLEGEIVITNRPYDTLYLLRAETHLNKVCTVLLFDTKSQLGYLARKSSVLVDI